MMKTRFLLLCLNLLLVTGVLAADKKQDDARELSGISIIGNKEAPKSLYIVPWKNSEVGIETSLSAGLLDESMIPMTKTYF